MTAHADVQAARRRTLDVEAIAVWTAANKAAREDYHRDPFALTRLSAARCRRCRDYQHFACTSQARSRKWRGWCICLCFIDDHHPRRTT